MKTTKEIAEASRIYNQFSDYMGDYVFTPEELQIFIDALCKEQKEICAKHHAFWYKASEAELELIKGLPQPEVI